MTHYVLVDYMLLPLILFITSVESRNERSDGYEMAVVLEFPYLINVDELSYSMTLSTRIILEWADIQMKNMTQKKVLPLQDIPSNLQLYLENVQKETRQNEIFEVMPNGLLRHRIFNEMTVRCIPFDYDMYPFDIQSCDLRLSSHYLNASQLVLIPYVIAPEDHKIGNSIWFVSIEKNNVEWSIGSEGTYEVAVFSFRLQRTIFPSFYIAVYIMFFTNFIMISICFPLFRLDNLPTCETSSSCDHLLILQTFITLLLSLKCPSMTDFPLLIRQSVSLLLLSIFIRFLSSLLPFFSFYLHCVPYDAHPYPNQYPTPADQFSLDSQRTKLSSAQDSARLDSSRSQRTAAVDLCMAELKYSLANLNEFLSAKSSAKWRKRQWWNGYSRVETATFFILSAINLIILLICRHSWH